MLIAFVLDNQSFFLSFLYTTEPKCYCIHPLDGQIDPDVKDGNGIMCEMNEGVQPNGYCSNHEYCAGPNTLEDAVCGKKELCNKKGTHEIHFYYHIFGNISS